MVQMLNTATGAVEDVPAEHAAQAFQSGQYKIHADEKLPVVGDDGQVGTVKGSEAGAAFAAGQRVATPEEYRKAHLDAKYGGLGGTLAAAGEGAVRGLTLGAIDPLAVGAAHMLGGHAMAEKVRTHLAEEKEAHPYVSTGAELLGAAAPILASGGAAAPEEAAALGARGAAGAVTEASTLAKIADGIGTLGVLPRGVSGLGDAAEHAVAGMLGDTAGSVIGRAGQAAAKSAVRGIVEGGLFGAGAGISDATLEDHPLTAEKLLASIGHGALLGGILGTAVGGGAKLASEGVQSALGHLAPGLEEAAGEQTWKWLDPGKKLSEEASKRAGGTDAVGRVVYDRVLRPLVEEGGLTAAAISNEEKLALVQKAVDQTGKDIAEHLQGNAHATAKLSDVLAPIEERIGEFRKTALGEEKVAQLEKLRDSVKRVLLEKQPEVGQQPGEAYVDFVKRLARGEPADPHVPVLDLIEQRRAVQKIAYQETRALDPNTRVQMLRDITGAWNDIEEHALNEASQGDHLAGQKLRELNKEFQRLKIAEKALETNTARYASNRNLSLSDYLAGAAHAPTMALGGHPLAAAAAVGSSFLHKGLRAHGNAYAALLLDRLASFGGVSKAAAEVNTVTDRALEQFMARTKPAARLAAKVVRKDIGPTGGKRYVDEEARVRQLAAASPALLNDHTQRQTAPLATHAPMLAQALQKQAGTATSFLVSKLPPSPLGTSSLTPQLQQPAVSAEQRIKFLRYVDAVEGGPAAVLRRFADGKMTPEDVETLEAVYPNSLAELRRKVASACADRKSPLSFQQRAQLGPLLGMPTDPMTTQPVIQALQQSYVTHPDSGKPGPVAPPHASAAMHLGNSFATPFEAATMKGG